MRDKKHNTWMRVAALFTVMLGNLCVFQGTSAFAITRSASAEAGRRNEQAVLKYVWPVLKSAGKVGRIYYRAVCPSNNPELVAFPEVAVRPPASNETGRAAIQDMFRSSEHTIVTEDKSGLIRIKLGTVSGEILKTRISTLKLDPKSQYNDMVAIGRIKGTREVKYRESELNMRSPKRPYNYITIQPADGLPHVPAIMTNITMEAALDVVALTFKGIVLYGECPRGDVYQIDFIGGIYFDDRSLR
jgi:hypothetical protein